MNQFEIFISLLISYKQLLFVFFFRKCSTTNGCFGTSLEQQNCNESPCPAATGTTTVGQWTGWSDWGSCSTTCGGGFKRRTRLCQHGICNGPSKDSLPCMIKHCKTLSYGSTASWGGKYSSTDTLLSQLITHPGVQQLPLKHLLRLHHISIISSIPPMELSRILQNETFTVFGHSITVLYRALLNMILYFCKFFCKFSF